MEHLYTRAPSSYDGGLFSGAAAVAATAASTASADIPPGAAAAVEAMPQRQTLHPPAVVSFRQQQQLPQVAAPSGATNAIHSYYTTPAAAGLVAGMCGLPAAAAPSAFVPLQQQQLRSSSSSTNSSRSAARYSTGGGTVICNTAHAGILSYSGGGFAASAYTTPSSVAGFYAVPPASAAAASSAVLPPRFSSPPTTVSCALPAVGFGFPAAATALDGTVVSTVVANSAAAHSSSSPVVTGSPAAAASAAIAAPLVGTAAAAAGAVPSSCATATSTSSYGVKKDTAFAASSPASASATTASSSLSEAGLPPRVALDFLSAEERGLLQQTRRLLQESISNTFECITLLSGVLLTHGGSPLIYHLLQAWEEAAQQQQSDEKMLCLLYVLNDALQKCRRRGCPLLLLLTLQPLHRFCFKIAQQHQSVLRSCIRVIRILKDAKAFGPPNKRCSDQIAEALLAALQGNAPAAAALPSMANIQQQLEAHLAEEGSSEAAQSQMSARLSGQQQQQQDDDAGGKAKRDKEGAVVMQQQQQQPHPPGGWGSAAAAGEPHHALQHKTGGGGYHGAAALGGSSVFLQHASNSINMRALPAAIDTFLLQYPVSGDEALAAHINDNYAGDLQEANLRLQVSEALAAIAAAQTALADKAVARRRVEERLRDLQHEQQRLRERAERVQQAAAGGAQAQLLLWQQMQQQLQHGGEKADFSLEGIVAEQERLLSLVKAAHAKLHVLLKTEWNRRVELQAVLLSLGQAIEKRLDVVLPQHVHCREVKSVIDRAALLQASRLQRQQRQQQQQEFGEEEQRRLHQLQEAQGEPEQERRQQQQQQEWAPSGHATEDQEQRTQTQEEQQQHQLREEQHPLHQQQHAGSATLALQSEDAGDVRKNVQEQPQNEGRFGSRALQQVQHEELEPLQQEKQLEESRKGGEEGAPESVTFHRGLQQDFDTVEKSAEMGASSSLVGEDEPEPRGREELDLEEQLFQEQGEYDGEEEEQQQLDGENEEEQPFAPLQHDGWLV